MTMADTPSTRWVTLLLLVAHAAASSAAASPSSLSPPGRFAGLHIISKSNTRSSSSIHRIHRIRGGAVDDSEEYDSEEYDSEEEDEPIVKTAKKLATSTKNVAQKRKTAAVKSKVKVAMAASSPAKAVSKGKGGGGNLYKRYVPYIVRACLNPFTLLAMTKAYFVSLCDINYLKEEQSQTLRSALQDKALKQQPTSGKPKRKMRPGQAKTINDLPQLSA